MGMRVKNILTSILPSFLDPRQIASKLYSANSSKILSGPFAGMTYIARAQGSSLSPKILGTYELELAEKINEWIARQPELVVDVGAAEGYYAVGFAWKNKKSRMIAFESEPAGRDLLSELSNLNGVSNQIEVYGECSSNQLQCILEEQHPLLVIMDVEGGEKEILANIDKKYLKSTTFIIETHPFIIPEVEEELKLKFQNSHRCSTISSRKRRAHDLPYHFIYRVLLWRWLEKLTAEYRPSKMNWLIFEPNS